MRLDTWRGSPDTLRGGQGRRGEGTTSGLGSLAALSSVAALQTPWLMQELQSLPHTALLRKINNLTARAAASLGLISRGKRRSSGHWCSCQWGHHCCECARVCASGQVRRVRTHVIVVGYLRSRTKLRMICLEMRVDCILPCGPLQTKGGDSQYHVLARCICLHTAIVFRCNWPLCGHLFVVQSPT